MAFSVKKRGRVTYYYGGDRPTLFCDLKSHKGLDDVVGWIKRECLFEAT